MSKKLLVVDDSASMLQMMAFTLKNAGYTVTEATDGQNGLEKAQTEQFDLVFTDQNMPNMDGLTMIQQLRQLPNYGKTPILMLTTEASEEMKLKGRKAGANGWLVKPFNPQKLLDVVQRMVGQ